MKTNEGRIAVNGEVRTIGEFGKAERNDAGRNVRRSVRDIRKRYKSGKRMMQ